MVKKIALILALALLALFASSFVFASQFTPAQKTVTLAKGSAATGDYFQTGGTVILSGDVAGDAYLAGANIIVDGNIDGDLIATGANITFSGKTAGNVRVLGGTVQITGQIAKNVTVAGGTVKIGDTAKIGGSLVSVSGDLTVDAPIGREATLSGGEVTLKSTVGGALTTGSSKITLGPSSVINGNLTYLPTTTVDVQKGAQIKGRIVKSTQDVSQTSVFKGALGLKLAGLLSMFIIALLLIRFTPNYLDKTTGIIAKRPLQSLFVGVLVLVGIPIVAAVLFLTIVGIPLSLILVLALIILAYLSPIFVSAYVGQKLATLLKIKAAKAWTVLLGLLTYALVSQIQLIGGLVTLLVLLVGVGAQLTERLALYKDLRARKLV